MRQLALSAALLGASLLSGCSFSTDFIVVNDSQQSIEVTYRFKFAGLITKPVTVPRSQVTTRRPEHGWELTVDRYTLIEYGEPSSCA